jgi:hypothetical protein
VGLGALESHKEAESGAGVGSFLTITISESS